MRNTFRSFLDKNGSSGRHQIWGQTAGGLISSTQASRGNMCKGRRLNSIRSRVFAFPTHEGSLQPLFLQADPRATGARLTRIKEDNSASF